MSPLRTDNVSEADLVFVLFTDFTLMYNHPGWWTGIKIIQPALDEMATNGTIPKGIPRVIPLSSMEFTYQHAWGPSVGGVSWLHRMASTTFTYLVSRMHPHRIQH